MWRRNQQWQLFFFHQLLPVRSLLRNLLHGGHQQPLKKGHLKTPFQRSLGRASPKPDPKKALHREPPGSSASAMIPWTAARPAVAGVAGRMNGGGGNPWVVDGIFSRWTPLKIQAFSYTYNSNDPPVLIGILGLLLGAETFKNRGGIGVLGR